jgi:hypothetical protein
MQHELLHRHDQRFGRHGDKQTSAESTASNTTTHPETLLKARKMRDHLRKNIILLSLQVMLKK